MVTTDETMSAPPAAEFERFVLTVEPRLRAALCAAYGPDLGVEAAAEALLWAWEHWERAAGLEFPIAYLFRVGQSKSRRLRRRHPIEFRSDGQDREPWVEPALPAAFSHLTELQRTSVGLVHGFGWSLQEVADLLEVSKGTVQTHVTRGIARLRDQMGVTIHD